MIHDILFKKNLAESLIVDIIHDNSHACSVLDNEGFLPLHRAIQDELSPDIIIALIEEYPQGCSIKFPNSDDYPLHVALFKKLPEETVVALLTRYRNCCEDKDDYSEYPLQIATAGPYSAKVVAPLFQAYPNAIEAVDEAGWLPLHRAVFHNSPSDAISFLIKSFPKACGIKDQSQNLPIHLALKSGSTHLETIYALLQAYPESCKSADENGWLPLHTAAAFYPLPEVVSMLVKIHKDACSVTNIVGRLPVHCVVTDGAMSTSRLDCLRILLKAYPAGAHYQMLSNGGTPIDAARRGWRGIPALRLLLNADPKILNKQPSNLNQYKHLNWKARKGALRVYVKIMTDKKAGVSPIPKTFIIETLVYRNYNKSPDALKVSNSIVPLFIKLCEKFEGNNRYTVSNETLRHILSYL